ncbi:DUF4245 family protein [Glycomyces xiaoerkulensis]|uniref:DUF4245 family protein n=1 Tax=Glycomyces xiaoerkulensis TaxID=2038139 RepID=UPI000C264AC6|nr:DUF4245 family protein [Glycomyces xiaoerkulensis]
MSSDDLKITGASHTRPKQRRLRDMVLSLAVLLVPLGIFLGVWQWAADDRQVSVADTSADYAAAEGLGLAPVHPELPEQWRPISSALAAGEEAVTLRTGWYSPEGAGLQLVQTDGEAAEVNEAVAGAGEPVEAAGIEWSSYDIPEGEAWVMESERLTVILTAETDGIAELPELAAGVAAGLGS